MAFVVEDGTIVTNANAYITVAYADTYHGDRNQGRWTGTVLEKEAAIIRATDHVDRTFGVRFRGIRQQREQPLEWPRYGATDDDGWTLDEGLPPQLLKAVAEYALRAIMLGVLTPDVPAPVPAQDLTSPTATGAGQAASGTVIRTKDALGPLEESRTYAEPTGVWAGPTGDALLPRYPAADLWLNELLISRNTSMLVRGD